MRTNTYLNFNGQCEEAFRFYAEVTGGTVELMLTNASMPGGEKCPPDQQSKILHASLRIGDTVIMGADAPAQFYSKPEGFSVSLSVGTAADAERIFKAMSEKGAVRMPMEETFFAHKFGMVVDRFGTPWMIICEKPMG